MTEWLHLACTRAVATRALRYAIVVGTLLIVINHSDAIMRGDVSPGRLLRMALTAMVPYMVSTASSVGAIRERRPTDRAQPATSGDRPGSTAT